METLIVYQSRKITTKKFAEEIAKRVKRIKGSVTVKSMEETTANDIRQCDLLFLGARTVGKYVFGQKPDKEWVEYVQSMPEDIGKKTVLFTTYDISSGRVFQRMKQYILPKGYNIVGSMKSHKGEFDYFSISVLKYVLDCDLWTVERSLKKLAEVS